MAPSAHDIRALFRQIRCWQKNGKRAPHKPLMLLFALARLQRGEKRGLVYEQIEEPFKKLLHEFGRPGRDQHPEFPFVRLENDGRDGARLWKVESSEPLRVHAGDVSVGQLRSANATGWFTPGVEKALRASRQLVNDLVAELLDENFERSIHQDILDAVGMPWVPISRDRDARDPEFRRTIIRIYEQRCAVCGFDGRLGGADLALEAAHIKWHAAGGSDREENGVCLCAIHHKALDRGAISIEPKKRVLVVSEELRASDLLDPLFLRYAGQPIRPPLKGHRSPSATNLQWHWNEVFHLPARAA